MAVDDKKFMKRVMELNESINESRRMSSLKVKGKEIQVTDFIRDLLRDRELNSLVDTTGYQRAAGYANLSYVGGNKIKNKIMSFAKRDKYAKKGITISEGVRSTAKAWDEIDSMMDQIPKTYVTVTLQDEPTKEDQKKVISAAKRVSKDFADYVQVTGNTIHITLYDKPKSGLDKKIQKAMEKALGQDVTVSVTSY